MTITSCVRGGFIGKPMLPRSHDDGPGLLFGVPSDVGEFINRQIGEIIQGVHTAVRELDDQLGGEPGEVAQVL